jgi:hypothetical protein
MMTSIKRALNVRESRDESVKLPSVDIADILALTL